MVNRPRRPGVGACARRCSRSSSCRLAAIAWDLPYGETPTRLEELAGERGWHYVSPRGALFQGVAQLRRDERRPPPVRAMAAARRASTRRKS